MTLPAAPKRNAPLSRWRPGQRWRWPLLVFLLSIGFGAALTWLAGADQVDGQPLMLTKRPLVLHNRQDLGQTMRARADGLHRIDVFFDSRGEVRSRQVRFLLFGSDGLPLVNQEVDAAELRDSWYAFTFPPIAGIAGDDLRLDLRRNAPVRDSIGVWVGSGGSYADGYGVIDNIPDPSFDLTFRAYSATPPDLGARARRVAALALAITTGRSGPLSQPAALLGLGILYAVGLAALVAVGVASLRRRP